MQLLDLPPGKPCVPAVSLAHADHHDIRTAAPASSLVASDDHYTILTAGGRGEYRIPWHSHDCLMVLMPVRGAINYRDEFSPDGSCLSEERFVVVPELVQHAGEADDTPHILLYLTNPVIQRIVPDPTIVDRIERQIRRTSFFAVTPEIRMLQYLCFAGDGTMPTVGASRWHIASALLLHVLNQIEKSEPLQSAGDASHGRELVREICAFVDLHLARDLSLDEIARQFRVSRRHATRLFKRWTGLSIAEYWEKQRIGRARTMLANTDLPVGQIAWRLGFESGSALARAMRRVTGQTPSAIRYHARLSA
jgi:AraC family transcriptional regulator